MVNWVAFSQGRLLAELYVMVQHFWISGSLEGPLQSDIWQLPVWGWAYTTRQYADGASLDMPGGLSLDIPVWKDLEYLRRQGNIAAHASTRMTFRDDGVSLRYVTDSAMRVSLSLAVWLQKLAKEGMAPIMQRSFL